MQENDLGKYAVFGNPIAHSLSPDIHKHFAKSTAINISYDKILSQIDDFNNSVVEFIKMGGNGFNITVPFKKMAFAICKTTSLNASLARAVNTIKIEDGNLIGDNTDGGGLVADFKKNINFDLANKVILILGAGGAAAGILHPLLLEQPKRVMIANRTTKKAEDLAKQFLSYGKNLWFWAR